MSTFSGKYHLDARAQFPGNTLADLYDPLTIPPALLKAHQSLDRAVMKLYGFPVKTTTEAGCVAALMELYQQMCGEMRFVEKKARGKGRRG